MPRIALQYAAFGIIALFLATPQARSAEDEQVKSSKPNTQKIVGYSLLGGGAAVAGIFLMAGMTGGDPCDEETRRDGETEDECRERVKKDQKAFRRIQTVVIPAGLATAGVGFWLVKTADDEDAGAALHYDGRSLSLIANTSF